MPTNPHRGRFKKPANTRSRQLMVERMLLNLEHLKRDQDELDYSIQALVPEAWDTLERDVDVCEKKRKVSLYLDDSVAKFFQGMGVGYQARINRILATFAQMRIAQIKKLDEMMEEELAKIDELRE